MRGQTVDDGAHSVLADSEVQVAPGKAAQSVIARLKIAEALEKRVRGRIEICRSACQRRQPVRDRIHDRSRCGARGDALRVGRKDRDIRVPVMWQLATQTSLKFVRQVRKGVDV